MIDKKEKEFSISENILFIFINPENSEQVLVSTENNVSNLIGFEYKYSKSNVITIDQSITNYLNSFDLNKESLQLIDVIDLICPVDSNIYKVYMARERITLNEKLVKSFKYEKIKKLTAKSNPLGKDLYLPVFLKILSNLDLIKYFKP